MVETRINGRWTLRLPEHRAARPEWASPLGWERERLNSMALHLGKGDVVIDVGAEEGDMSALYALWGAAVVLVEPNPKVWPNIKAIFDANDLGLMVLDWFVGFCAAKPTDVATEFTLPTGSWWPACAEGPVIGDHGFRHLAEEADITPCTTVDILADSIGHDPTAITIDVEGAELEVLRGAHDTLAEHRPLVWCSVHPQFMRHHFGQDVHELHAYMRNEHGYRGHLLASDHEEHWLFLP